MSIKERVFLLLCVGLILLLAGCNGTNTFNVQNPPPPPQNPVAIAFSSAPPAVISILPNPMPTVSATVSNDPQNDGVDWELAVCQSSGTNCNAQLCAQNTTCGTLYLASDPSKTQVIHSASGDQLTYQPPSAFPSSGNSMYVAILALATADRTKNVLAPVSITAFGSGLKAGNYVVQVQGFISTPSGSSNYQLAGVVTLGNDGSGNGDGSIVGGEQTVNFLDGATGTLVSKSDPIVSGSYFLGPDGRGTLTVVTNDTDIGFGQPGAGQETFTIVFLNNSQALIAQGDLPNSTTGSCSPCTGASGTGTMDLQASPIVAPSGAYAFTLSGQDVATLTPTAIGGILNLDTLPAGSGSVIDQVLSNASFPPSPVRLNRHVTGTISTPDPLGQVTLNLTTTFVTGSPSTLTLTGYIVDSSHIKLIESDNNSGAGFASTAGVAIAQSDPPGTFTLASFTGPYTFNILGSDLTATGPASMTSGGVFNVDGAGNLSNGFTDTFLQANVAQQAWNSSHPNQGNPNPGAQISTTFSAPYSVDARGRVTTNHPLTLGLPISFGRIPVVEDVFYLTGSQTPALVLTYSDITFSGTLAYPFLGVGNANPQAASALTFDGAYGLTFTQFNGSETDASAQATATAASQSLSAVADVSVPNFVTLNQPFFGLAPAVTNCSAATVVDGCFAESVQDGTAQAPSFGTPFLSPNQPFSADFYVVDQDHGFFIETDLTSLAAPSGIVSMGSYVRRTPICSTCP